MLYPTFFSKTLLLGSNANGVLASNVYLVNSLYHQLLNRTPDVSEVNLWVFQLEAGVSPAQVAESLWLTALMADLYREFFSRTGTKL